MQSGFGRIHSFSLVHRAGNHLCPFMQAASRVAVERLPSSSSYRRVALFNAEIQKGRHGFVDYGLLHGCTVSGWSAAALIRRRLRRRRGCRGAGLLAGNSTVFVVVVTGEYVAGPFRQRTSPQFAVARGRCTADYRFHLRARAPRTSTTRSANAAPESAQGWLKGKQPKRPRMHGGKETSQQTALCRSPGKRLEEVRSRFQIRDDLKHGVG